MTYDVPVLRFRLHHDILAELEYPLPATASVLDFGCGAGDVVAEYRRRGYNAVGCDIELPQPADYVHLIDRHDYRLPFPDHSFDFVFSDQVMEHVRDHSAAFREIARVLRPGGVSLHIFPAKWKPTEVHVFVPFGGAIQQRWWLLLWAWLGIRNSYQAGKSYREVADLNCGYLRNCTHYVSKAELLKAVSHHFTDVVLAERYLIKHSYGRARHIYPLARVAPFVITLYRSFYSRAIFLRK